jgi:hypothetical protein
MVFTHAVVGLGPAGIFTLACIPKQYLATTVVIESQAVGGTLAAHYGAVLANIPKSVILDALRKIPNWTSFPLLEKYRGDECPLLADVCRQIRTLIVEDLTYVTFHTKRMTALQISPAGWRITMEGDVLEAQKVFLCIGATPKTLDLPVPHIPLHVALNRPLLQQYVSPTDSIVVFGTSHSGTLILKHLKDIGCAKVTALYKGKIPFRFARDGDTEGIKQESATIADEILAGAWGSNTPQLVSCDDFATAYRAVAKATHVIYAVGFEKPAIRYKTIGGEERCLKFRPATNDFEDVKHLWGFGIGFPSMYTGTNGNQYPDVGFGGFIDAIKPVASLT